MGTDEARATSGGPGPSTSHCGTSRTAGARNFAELQSSLSAGTPSRLSKRSPGDGDADEPPPCGSGRSLVSTVIRTHDAPHVVRCHHL